MSLTPEDPINFSESGIGKLTGILHEHLERMKQKDAEVEQIISSAQTAASLREAKKKALQNEKKLLLTIIEDIDEMNTFLKNIILIENLFNSQYQPHKRQQEDARAKYAKNIASFENKDKMRSEASSFVELIFGGQTHVSSFQEWLDKVVKQCQTQNIHIKQSSGAKVKKIERAFYKSFYVYDKKDGFKDMTDILRCSLVFDNFEHLYKCFSVIESLADEPGILRVKDRFHPTGVPFGYRDLLINIYCPGSKVIAEIQLHFMNFYKYKKVSHKMYKRARLFERDTCNLAYEYSTKFMRPKIGTFKTYEASKDELEEGGDMADEKEDGGATQTPAELLKLWGLSKYTEAMIEEGWEDIVDWADITDEDLKNDIGFSKGHIRKFRRKYQEWVDQNGDDTSSGVAIVAASQEDMKQDNDKAQASRIVIGELCSLEAFNYPCYFIRHRNGELWADNKEESALYKQDATWKVVKGLYGNNTVSFQSTGAYSDCYARHCNFTLQISRNDQSELFRKDASFYVRKPLTGAANFMSLESVNFPNYYVRHQGFRIKISAFDNTNLFKADASWKKTMQLKAKEKAFVGDWQCNSCEYKNFAKNTKCRQCNKGRAKERVSLGDWQCNSCEYKNFAKNTKCRQCNKGRPKMRGDWDCSQCGVLNFASRKRCFKCNASVTTSTK